MHGWMDASELKTKYLACQSFFFLKKCWWYVVKYCVVCDVKISIKWISTKLQRRSCIKWHFACDFGSAASCYWRPVVIAQSGAIKHWPTGSTLLAPPGKWTAIQKPDFLYLVPPLRLVIVVGRCHRDNTTNEPHKMQLQTVTDIGNSVSTCHSLNRSHNRAKMMSWL